MLHSPTLAYSIIPPNTHYAVFTTKNCITTGGYYFSIPNIANTLYGIVHSFIWGAQFNDGDENLPSLMLYLRRIIHYLHNSLVVNNQETLGNYSVTLLCCSFYKCINR